MPEIKNEIPTDEEIRAYLDESLRGSSTSMLAGYMEDPQRWTADVGEALSYLSAYRPEFLALITDTIFQASRRLNQLPRDDPFWRNTNRRPTIYKLPEHSKEVLRNDPNDVLSLMTIVVLDVSRTGDFNPELWSRLYRLKAVGLDFITFAAMLLLVAGSPNAEEFCVFVKETCREKEALPILREITAKGGKMLSEWSAAVEVFLGTTERWPAEA